MRRRPPNELQAEVDEELRVHLEMRIGELVTKGVPLNEAREEALRRFGDLEHTRRYCRNQDKRKEAAMRWHRLVDELAQDLRNGVRPSRSASAPTRRSSRSSTA